MKLTRRAFLAVSASAAGLAAPPRSAMGLASTCYMTVRRFQDTIEFLDHCHALGAGGIQSSLASLEPDYVRRLRVRAEEQGIYIEVMAGLPRPETGRFEQTVRAAREAGALCVRAACLGGRRYETFSTLDEWKKFAVESRAAIGRALPIAEKYRLPLAVENHKDWTLEEMLPLLKQYESEYLGVCLDTGNNMALLDPPGEFAEQLAPYAVSTHIKDMGLREYPEGLLLAEVPLGEGLLDLKRVVQVISKARPATRMTLEMITRNPLKVPCLTPNYWVTFPHRKGPLLARMLRLARTSPHRDALPVLDELDREARMRLEEDNVKQCLNYARQQLGL